MKTTLIAVLLAAPVAVLAQNNAPMGDDRGHNARLFERYCERLRESPEAYVQFVRRLKPIYGYTYTDFAPEQAGATVRANCRVSPARVSAVHRMLAQEKR